jgi:2-oxoglutarate dehydrogenase E1 component
MATNPNESFLSGGNIDFIESLYARFLEDPASVDGSWRELFAGWGGGRPIVAGLPAGGAPLKAPAGAYSNGTHANGAVGHGVLAAAASGPDRRLQARVDAAIYAFRLRGHLLAQLDPLGRPRPTLEHWADLAMAEPNAFTASEQEQVVDANEVVPKAARLSELLERLRRTYCHHVGVEYMTILDSARRNWLRARMELSENRAPWTRAQQLRFLERLSYAEAFEHSIAVHKTSAKRFALDGGESLIPMLDVMLETAGELGAEEVVIGMAHRGRLNVLANVLQKSPDQIFSEFQGPSNPKEYLGRGDVKYHMGFSSDHVTPSGKKIHLSLAFNPSHLEMVNPVVTGRVRAKQDRKQDTNREHIIPVLIHGDAAFAGQGVVAETLNLAGLKGYSTGGTIHVVINNQVGFTTDPEDSRSFIYCTGFAQMLDVPVFHVNGDDPEACAYVMGLATQYRQAFKSDVVIDFICYRRFGHNEGDDPSFTQPTMYQLIKERPKVRQLYAEDLARRERVTPEEAEAIKARATGDFNAAWDRVAKNNAYKSPSFLEGLWKNYTGGADSDVAQVQTGVPVATLKALLEKLASTPEGFTTIRQITQLLQKRRDIAAAQSTGSLPAAEHLAYATLLTEGVPVRMTGQDIERGTFSHRHAVLHDSVNGATHTPLKALDPRQGPLWIYNSPLSEMGPLGFEYGFSLDFPDALVIWEAQFGDFANMAQGIIDQFISASEEKWKRLTGVTLLLPHGYEGQGPEHSSARLERFLDLCGDDNMQVCYPTTPAQIFHLLRRQVHRPLRKPLVVMSPKGPLRRDEVNSSLEELAQGQFQRVIADLARPDPAQVERLVLCSGKVYWDLAAARAKQPDPAIALVRVEQLYPFPHPEITAMLASMPRLKTLMWVQEEPQNMGAWHYMLPILEEQLQRAHRSDKVDVTFVGRAESASPATGVEAAHKLEQEMIIEQALKHGGPRGR